MACPHVAGVAALILSQHPEFSPDQVSQVIRASADDIEAPGFDVRSGAGRLNAYKALLINSVPRVSITGPRDPQNVTNTNTVTISGNAYGPAFSKYQLSIATLNKNQYSSSDYATIAGPWVALGQAVSQSVNNGILATVNKNSFISGQNYLLKLEVTTTDLKKYSDVREILVYQDDPTWTKLADITFPVKFQASAADTFAWIQSNNDIGYGFLKIYHGKSNKFITVNPTEASSVIKKVFLTPTYLVWEEIIAGNATVKIATLSSGGNMSILRTLNATSVLDADQNKLLLVENGNPAFYKLHTIADNTSVSYSRESSTTITSELEKLSGNSIAYHWKRFPYAGASTPVEAYVILRDVIAGTRKIILNNMFPAGPPPTPNRYCPSFNIVHTTGFVGHVFACIPDGEPENNIGRIYNKISSFELGLQSSIHKESFGFDNNKFIFSHQDTSIGLDDRNAKTNISSYDTSTYQISPLISSVPILTRHKYPFVGIKPGGASKAHISWSYEDYFAESMRLMASNTPPSFASIVDRSLYLNQPFSLTVSATDPELDSLNLSAVRGTWPGNPTALPPGATFVDNGNGSGSFNWTPTAKGMYTIYFLARDFSGRMNNTWNTAKPVLLDVKTAPANAQFISQSVPGTMFSGQTYRVSVTMKNTGQDPWTQASKYKLGSANPKNNLTWLGVTNRILLGSSETVLPGQQKTFTFDVKAPNQAGVYNFQWQMVQDGFQWFGDYTPNIAVNVQNCPVQAMTTVNPSNGYAPLNSNFTVSINPICANVTHQTFIDYGDASVQNWTPMGGSISFNHVYPNPGNYKPTIVVKNSQGMQTVISHHQITVTPPPFNVNVYVSPSSGYSPLNTTFMISVAPSAYSGYQFSIDFADGTSHPWTWTTEFTAINHTYYTYYGRGFYPATITVKDIYGTQKTVVSPVLVADYPPPYQYPGPAAGDGP